MSANRDVKSRNLIANGRFRRWSRFAPAAVDGSAATWMAPDKWYLLAGATVSLSPGSCSTASGAAVPERWLALEFGGTARRRASLGQLLDFGALVDGRLHCLIQARCAGGNGASLSVSLVAPDDARASIAEVELDDAWTQFDFTIDVRQHLNHAEAATATDWRFELNLRGSGRVDLADVALLSAGADRSGVLDEDMLIAEAIRLSGTLAEDIAANRKALSDVAALGSALERGASDAAELLSADVAVARTAAQRFEHGAFGVLKSLQAPGRRLAPKGTSVAPRHQLKVVVIAWDLAHNPAGRAYMLAEALAQRFEIVLVGPLFPRYGTRVWSPLTNTHVPVISFPGRDLPDFLLDVDRLAERVEADAIVICKPRLPSLLLGLKMRDYLRRPVILDIDDHELAFVSDPTPLRLDLFDSIKSFPDLLQPYGQTWTRLAADLIEEADEVLVSNVALQGEFGGLLVPHARDSMVFDPERYQRQVERDRFGLRPDQKVVLFLGTVRPHKGVHEVLARLREINDPDVVMVVMGDIPDLAYREQLGRAGGDCLRLLPSQPFDDLARNVVIADLVVLLQDPSSRISKYQLPAKVIDAISMGVPVLATPTGPLQPMIDAGVILKTSPRTLGADIRYVLGNLSSISERARGNRSHFIENYSYSAIADTVEGCILSLLEQPLPAVESPRMERLQTICKDLVAGHHGTMLSSSAKSGIPLLVFWKQNDSTLYGRRVDMMVKYLAQSSGISKVMVFDAPTDVSQLQRWAAGGQLSQHAEVFRRTLAKRWGLLDSEGVSYHCFVSAGQGRTHRGRRWEYPRAKDYLKFVQDELRDADVVPGDAVLLAYPRNDWLPKVIDSLKPRAVVVDLVDDHRTWANLSKDELFRIETNYQEVLARADIALANCEPVRESMSRWFDGIELVPNACELDAGVEDDDSDSSPPADIADLEGPVIGYVGNLEDKIDWSWVEFAARARPDFQFLFIGSAHTDPSVLSRASFPNIHFLGVKPYQEIRAYLSAMNVAIIPHVVNEKTRSMNPLKLYVYLAHKLPVVCSEIENAGALAQWCQVCSSAEEFVEALDRAVAQGPSEWPDPLADLLRRNSWPERVQHLLSRLDLLLADPNPVRQS